MLQPRKYPEMIGQALVLEPEPFMVMADDDNPWVEGLFLTVTVAILVGLAELVGGFLLAASLPDPNAVLETLLQMWRQVQPAGLSGAEVTQAENSLRQWWWLMTGLTGYQGGWLRLLVLVVTPLSWIVQWLVYGLVGHGLARMLGGTGNLNQTLGATALAVAPQVLLLLTFIPFVTVGSALLTVWGLLIIYRGLEVAHELPWEKAVVAALVPLLVLFFGTLVISAGIGMLVSLIGGGL